MDANTFGPGALPTDYLHLTTGHTKHTPSQKTHQSGIGCTISRWCGDTNPQQAAMDPNHTISLCTWHHSDPEICGFSLGHHSELGERLTQGITILPKRSTASDKHSPT